MPTNIDAYWLGEGHYLGLRMRVGDRPQDVWFRIIGREYADYSYAFASLAANTAGTFIDILDSSSNYILNPPRIDVIDHVFISFTPSNCILFMEYPANVDRNSLSSSRAVDANGNGGWWGKETPIGFPNIRTEIFTLRDLRPTFAIFNNDQTNAQVVRLRLYAMRYLVAGPYVYGDGEISDAGKSGDPVASELFMRDLVNKNQARLATIYGVDPVPAPQHIVTRMQGRLEAMLMRQGQQTVSSHA